MLKRVLLLVERMILGRARSDLRWWQRRARRYGVRSVYSLGHTRDALESVTRKQLSVLMPVLQTQLRGDEKLILDYGCGPGRFTAALADLTGGRVIGVDPIAHLVNFAPSHPRVEYALLSDGRIPIEPDTVDVAWITLVLMTIVDARALAQAVSELRRVLKPGGLIFLVENIDTRLRAEHLAYRSAEEYIELFSWAQLKQVGEYEDLGERIAIMAGRAA